jgi:RNA-binding protein Luc7-like 2
MKEIGEIELSIQGGTEEIEALGEAGKVEESMEKLSAVEALKGLKGEKEKELQNLNETAGASGHQKLRVCETCVCLLSPLTHLSFCPAPAYLWRTGCGGAIGKGVNAGN